MPKIEEKAGSRPPWVGLGAAVWVEFAAGNSYTFPLFSPSLKSVLGFTQQQITILGVANDFGESVGILPGIACNKFPPWAVLSFGAFGCFLGYGLLWLSVSQTLNFPYWLLWIALVIGANSSAWFGTAVLVTNMRNFPMSRGTVAGLLKGYVGLSAAIYTEIYSMVLRKSDTSLLLFLTIGLPIICFSLMYFIRPCTPASGENPSENLHFLFTQGASIFLGIYLLTTTFVVNKITISSAVCYVFIAIMVILMMAPLVIPIKMTFFPSDKKVIPHVGSSNQLGLEGDDSIQIEPLLEKSSSELLGSFQEDEESFDLDILLAVGEGAVNVKKKRRPRRGEDFKFREVLIKADFWLLWVVYFLGVGTGVTVLNNLAQIGYAQGEVDTSVLLSLFAFCNFIGRLGGGAVSEYFVRLKTMPRTIWMTITQLLMVVSYLLYAYAISGVLHVSTALLGICYGAQTAVMIPTASELFGLKHFGVIYNCIGLGNPIAALLLSGLLAGYVYDAEAAKQGTSTCIGASCFKLTFFVLAGLCGLGSLLSIILTIRIRPVYQMLYAGGSFRSVQRSDH